MPHSAPKLHNAMWPGLVGKGTDAGQEPPISLERMLELTAAATVNGQKFDGIDYFLFLPHTNPEASDSELVQIADTIAKHGFSVGSLVAPVWPGTVGVHDVATPTLIRFGQMTADELFISADAATAGYTVTNTGPGPLVSLRYFGPDVHSDLPMHGRNA